MRIRKRFKGRPPAQQVVLVIVGLLSLGVVALAERDIQRRPTERVRGPKLVWRIASTNALGALAYFGAGRRQPKRSSHFGHR